MLSSKTILKFVTAEPGRGGYAGLVESAKRSIRPQGFSRSTAPVSHHRLIDELQHRASATPQMRETYAHPEEDPRALRDANLLQAKSRFENDAIHELKPADLLWLERLPRDPAQVTYEDAVQLAGMARASQQYKDKSNARLIQSMWLPVKEVHDARRAEIDLRNARLPRASVPTYLPAALTDAIAAEVPELSADEASARAHRLINEATATEDGERASAVHRAQAAISTAAQSKAARLSVTKV